MRITITEENFVRPFKCRLDIDQSTIPYMAEALEEIDTVPGVHGDIQLSARYGSSNHILVMRSWPDISPEEKNAMIRDVDAFVSRAMRETQELYYERLGRIYYVKYVGLVEKSRERASWLEFRLPLKAHDPLGYAGHESSRGITGKADNRGNEPAPARMEFKGGLANPRVTVNGVIYAYSGTVPIGNTLVVDSRRQTAFIRNDTTRAETNANTGWNGNFLVLQPGPVTEITQIAAGTNQFTLFWRNCWS